MSKFFLLQVNVRVTTMDAELEFSFHPNTTGKQLFDQVCMLQCEKHHKSLQQIFRIIVVSVGNFNLNGFIAPDKVLFTSNH